MSSNKPGSANKHSDKTVIDIDNIDLEKHRTPLSEDDMGKITGGEGVVQFEIGNADGNNIDRDTVTQD